MSTGDHQPPGIADLTNWFLAAKRSLNSVTYCTRGNEIITFTRNALMDASIIASRSAFVRVAIQDQLKLLWQAKTMMEVTREAARKEFHDSLQELDDANGKLDETLNLLRGTRVEAAFGAIGPGEMGVELPERTLYDFVDEDGIENLRSQLREVIDQVQEADETFESHLQPFSDILDTATKKIESLPKTTGPSANPSPADSMVPLLQSLEEHAAEMAGLLESLAKHYDLCSLALKTAESHDAGGPGPDQENREDKQTEEDKANMFQVLQNDAAEVDDVVNEIKERLEEMEVTGGNVEKTFDDTDSVYRTLVSILTELQQCQGSLGSCVTQSKDFGLRQQENKEVIAERLYGLQQLSQHYAFFWGAYDALLAEVGRRIEVQRKKELIIQDALAKVEMLNEGDLNDRDAFRQEYGDYLPSDIWPGLSNPPGSYTIQRTDALDIPDISPAVIKEAIMRRASAMSPSSLLK